MTSAQVDILCCSQILKSKQAETRSISLCKRHVERPKGTPKDSRRMAQVPQQVLNWLSGVISVVRISCLSKAKCAKNGQEYQDPRRTYSDVAQTLSTFPSFSLRTDVYSPLFYVLDEAKTLADREQRTKAGIPLSSSILLERCLSHSVELPTCSPYHHGCLMSIQEQYRSHL